ncbi:Laminin subunit gamma-1 [Schistosoma haematobium]|uniref:Laminin subunit gamma-1 n=1 Tax=Schistosoma haematobium TaxID=6185 RepID=A0A922IQA8_SCHHA|nr:Laminin subunit gamma-1 [Schistosoma haematobium]KAH9584853.1 Laminin subunit gamma-1 [Schistosoma haematobium]
MHMNTNSVSTASASVNPNKHIGKRKILKYNTENTNTISLDREALEEVETSTYLDSIINEQGGSDVNVNASIVKAMTALLQLKNICNSKQLSVNQYQSHNLQYERQDSQFYCTELKRAELLQPSSKWYQYL